MRLNGNQQRCFTFLPLDHKHRSFLRRQLNTKRKIRVRPNNRIPSARCLRKIRISQPKQQIRFLTRPMRANSHVQTRIIVRPSDHRRMRERKRADPSFIRDHPRLPDNLFISQSTMRLPQSVELLVIQQPDRNPFLAHRRTLAHQRSDSSNAARPLAYLNRRIHRPSPEEGVQFQSQLVQSARTSENRLHRHECDLTRRSQTNRQHDRAQQQKKQRNRRTHYP